MPAISLEGLPLRSARPRYLDFGGELTPPLGGAVQRLNRLGNRFALEIDCAPVPEEPTGRIWTQKLRLAKREGASFPWPQPGLAIGQPGAPVVDGAVAGGTAVPIRGLTAAYAIRAGQFLNVIAGGVRYLHSAAEQAIADATGEAVLTIDPELRVSLADGDAIELAKPLIEGLIGSGDMDWDIMREPFTGLQTVVIREAE